MLEHKPYDIVLCDYHFEGTNLSGQDLLDELRRENLLPYSTVFVMVTGEATYAKVMEAAENESPSSLEMPGTMAIRAPRSTVPSPPMQTISPVPSTCDGPSGAHTSETATETPWRSISRCNCRASEAAPSL